MLARPGQALPGPMPMPAPELEQRGRRSILLGREKAGGHLKEDLKLLWASTTHIPALRSGRDLDLQHLRPGAGGYQEPDQSPAPPLLLHPKPGSQEAPKCCREQPQGGRERGDGASTAGGSGRRRRRMRRTALAAAACRTQCGEGEWPVITIWRASMH